MKAVTFSFIVKDGVIMAGEFVSPTVPDSTRSPPAVALALILTKSLFAGNFSFDDLSGRYIRETFALATFAL
jgi:hypothetical protein